MILIFEQGVHEIQLRLREEDKTLAIASKQTKHIFIPLKELSKFWSAPKDRRLHETYYELMTKKIKGMHNLGMIKEYIKAEMRKLGFKYKECIPERR